MNSEVHRTGGGGTALYSPSQIPGVNGVIFFKIDLLLKILFKIYCNYNFQLKQLKTEMILE